MYDSNIHFPAWVALVPDTRCFRDNRGCHTYKWPMADDQWFTLAAGGLLLIIIGHRHWSSVQFFSISNLLSRVWVIIQTLFDWFLLWNPNDSWNKSVDASTLNQTLSTSHLSYQHYWNIDAGVHPRVRGEDNCIVKTGDNSHLGVRHRSWFSATLIPFLRWDLFRSS